MMLVYPKNVREKWGTCEENVNEYRKFYECNRSLRDNGRKEWYNECRDKGGIIWRLKKELLF